MDLLEVGAPNEEESHFTLRNRGLFEVQPRQGETEGQGRERGEDGLHRDVVDVHGLGIPPKHPNQDAEVDVHLPLYQNKKKTRPFGRLHESKGEDAAGELALKVDDLEEFGRLCGSLPELTNLGSASQTPLRQV